jgi:hypothetical protein
MEMTQVQTQKVPFKRGLKYGSVAGVVYFFIAFFANWNHPLETKIYSSLSHGLFCMVMTFFSTSMMEFFFNSFKDLIKKYIFAVVCSGAVSLTLMISVHLIMGTPEVFTTVFASALTSAPYYLLFPLKLVFEYEAKIDRFAYRQDQNWRREWKIQKISRPYNIKDFLRVVLLNLTKISKKNPLGVDFVENKFQVNSGEANLRIGFLGDLMPMYKYSWALGDGVKDLFKDIDYLVCNFEGLLEGLEDGKSVLLSQNHNRQILNSLKEILPADKIILSVANNHSADYGYEYFKSNIKALKEEGFNVIGARDAGGILLPEGINIVGATQWSNQHHGYLNFLEFAKDSRVDEKLNILYPHWGFELELYPRKEFYSLAMEKLKDWDTIIGHHSHIPGPVTIDSSQSTKKVLAYSLGDSATGLFRRRYRHGIALTLDIETSKSTKAKIISGEWIFTQLRKTDSTSYDLERREHLTI